VLADLHRGLYGRGDARGDVIETESTQLWQSLHEHFDEARGQLALGLGLRGRNAQVERGDCGEWSPTAASTGEHDLSFGEVALWHIAHLNICS